MHQTFSQWAVGVTSEVETIEVTQFFAKCAVFSFNFVELKCAVKCAVLEDIWLHHSYAFGICLFLFSYQCMVATNRIQI